MSEHRLPAVRGLLIEGVDYAGKTTIMDGLAERLESQRCSVFRRACFMHEHPIIEALLGLAKASDRMDVRDTCYTSSILLDLTLPPLPSLPGYLLQERHTLTQIARNTFFYDDRVRWQVDTMMRLRRRFTCQIYLTSDLATKRIRTRTRPPKSPRDALLANDPSLHQKFDDFSRNSLPADEDWLIVDTSGRNVPHICRQILDHLQAREELLRHAGV
jgi:thymidylate kinase